MCEKLGAKTLRTFHEAAGSASGQLGHRRPPMRLSYYGGGHYDSVSPINDSVHSEVPPVGAEVAAVGGAAESVEPVREPGRLEEEALERSTRRAAESGGRRCGVAIVRVSSLYCC